MPTDTYRRSYIIRISYVAKMENKSDKFPFTEEEKTHFKYKIETFWINAVSGLSPSYFHLISCVFYCLPWISFDMCIQFSRVIFHRSSVVFTLCTILIISEIISRSTVNANHHSSRRWVWCVLLFSDKIVVCCRYFTPLIFTLPN